jgi:7-cyano-7-deazaguanine synthase in queuosine biosynthesis
MSALREAAVVFGDEPGSGEVRLKPGVNLHHGHKAFKEEFGEPTSLEEDLLVLAAAIFASDLSFKRGEREEITRQIQLTVPVVNLAAFESIKVELKYALYRLSHDAWDIRFTAKPGVPETTSAFPTEADGNVLLFSGGLDSFAAAVKYGTQKEEVHLVSHVTRNLTVSRAQDKVFEHLVKKYKKQFRRTTFRVSGLNRSDKGYPFASDDDREESQRTRSFLFLSLAGLVARRRGFHRIVMIAENGQMAIHLPLTAARIGSFSTHTAHPNFVIIMGTLLSKLFSFSITIENPFLYLTKAEVVRDVVLKHSKALSHAVSCWKASRVSGGFNHCGFCVPCLIRRISIEAHGVQVAEYKRDLFIEDIGMLDPTDEGKRNLADLGEFIHLFTTATPAQLEAEYPELIDSSFSSEQACAMYKRFTIEAKTVFEKYPGVKKFLT